MTSLPKRATAFALALIFSLSCHFCAVECAFASTEHHHAGAASEASEQHHSSEGQKDKDPEKHDAGSPCCSDLVAVKGPTLNAFDSQLLLQSHLASGAVFSVSSLVLDTGTLSKYKTEFPPGASPPTVFLLAHTAHAPPTAL